MTSRLLYAANPNTSALLLRLRDIGKLPSDDEIASKLSGVDADLVDRWVMGDELPPLKILPELAEIADVNHECLVVVWLSDKDPTNADYYSVMATQLMRVGGPTANPFFKG